MKFAGKLAIIFCIMLLAFCPFVYMTLSAQEVEAPSGAIEYWDGEMATGFAGGSGTAEDPFLISTPGQFAYFLHLRNIKHIEKLEDGTFIFYSECHYRLTCDLYFNRNFDGTHLNGDWTLHQDEAIGLKQLPYLSSLSGFEGTFDGGGYTLYNMYCPSLDKDNYGGPLFGRLAGYVHDLHVSGGYMAMTESNAGTFASTICKSLVLSTEDEERSGIIKNCTSSLTIAAYPVPGYAQMSSVGGIAGQLILVNADGVNTGISNCEFSGTIRSKASRVGGILGSYEINGGEVVFKNLVNRGDILGPTQVGGIIGAMHNYQSREIKSVIFEDCFNFGRVASERRDSSNPSVYLGGMVGYMHRVQSRTFDSCGHYGTVIANYGTRVGGMIGQLDTEQKANNTVFRDCVVSGFITGREMVGGYMGHSTRNSTLDNCIFEGTVTSVLGKAGAIQGTYSPSIYSATSVNLDLHSCDIRGSVTGGSNVGGLVGVWQASGYGTGIRLFGTLVDISVTGTTGVGGAIGAAESSYNGKTVPYSLYSSLFRARVAVTTANGTMGLFIGKLGENVTAKLGVENLSYLTGQAFKEIQYQPVVEVTPAPVVAGQEGVSTLGEWQDVYMQDGTLATLLSDFQAQPGYHTPRWNVNNAGLTRYVLNVSLSRHNMDRPYDGLAPELPKIYGFDPEYITVQWYKAIFNANGTQILRYDMISSTPTIIGQYQVSIYYRAAGSFGSVTLDCNITAAEFDLSTLKWDYTTPFLYNATTHKVQLVDVPEIFHVTYQNEARTNAGEYTAYATIRDLSGNCKLIGEVPTCTWTIQKVTIDASTISWNYDPKNPPVYTGEPYRVELLNKGQMMGDLLKVEATGNMVATDAGKYSCTATFTYDVANVELINNHFGKQMRLDWEILPRVLDLSVIEVSDQTVEYDGTKHSLMFPSVDLLFDDIPGGVLLAECIGGEQVYPGVHPYTMIVSLDPAVAGNYRMIGKTIYHADLIIKKATPTVLAVGADKVYDGAPIYIRDGVITYNGQVLNFPLSYEYYYGDEMVPVSEMVNGGTYTVKVKFKGNDLYQEAETSVKVYINRALIELPGNIVLQDGKVLYNGKPQNLEISGILPDGVTPVYSSPRTDPGVYTVTCKLAVNEQNYQPLPTLTATMTILAETIFDDDFENGPTLEFENGALTSLNIKVYNRLDYGNFRTRKYGMFTSMKALYRIVLREGYEAIDPEAPVLIHIPLTQEMKGAGSVRVVKVDVKDNGKYSYVDIPVVKKFDDENPDEFACIIKNGEVIIKSMTTDTYGIISKDSTATAFMWLGISLGIGAIAGAMTFVAWRYRKRNGKPKQI